MLILDMQTQLLLYIGMAWLSYASPLYAQEIYMWHDDKGVVHFSDWPHHPDAKAIPMPSTNRALVPLKRPTSSSDQAAAHTSTVDHASITEISITIVSPTMDETIHNNNGEIDLYLQLSRPLNEHETIQWFLDGTPWSVPQRHIHTTMHNVDRGSHSLSAEIKQDGKVIARSTAVTVHLHRASIQMPHR